MKIDPYNYEQRYLNWKKSVEDGIQGMSKQNSDIVLAYLRDMEIGANVASVSVKGPRGYNRLTHLKEKLLSFSHKFEELYTLSCITDIKEEQLFDFFYRMESGLLKRKDGKKYIGTDTYVKIFKAFWHWHQKVQRKRGNAIQDITADLNVRKEKPDWVYLTEEEVRELAENSKFEYKVLIYFLFDSGIRAPTELINVRVNDLFNDLKELNIREETSKTFGRRIKLMICSDLLSQYVKLKGLKPEDQLFNISPGYVNRYLKTTAKRLFGDKVSPAGEKYSNLTMYDFRHCSCCYWLPRYKSESALKYRFGWKKSDKIHYYSELLGMKDTIAEEDLLIDVTKTEIEKKLEKSEKEKVLMQERLSSMELQMAKIMEVTNQLHIKVIA